MAPEVGADCAACPMGFNGTGFKCQGNKVNDTQVFKVPEMNEKICCHRFEILKLIVCFKSATKMQALQCNTSVIKSALLVFCDASSGYWAIVGIGTYLCHTIEDK